MLEQLTDEELIEDFKNGNETVVDYILSKYKTLVNSVARRYYLIGAEQEDLAQEGMIGLYKACIGYKPTANNSFKTFAYLCVQRQIQSAVKTANRQKNLILNNALSLNSQSGLVIRKGDDLGDNETFLYLPSNELTPENKLIEKENYNETIKKIKTVLSGYEYEVLKQYLKGYKCEQIAQILQKDFKSVDNALSRIKTKLDFIKE